MRLQATENIELEGTCWLRKENYSFNFKTYRLVCWVNCEKKTLESGKQKIPDILTFKIIILTVRMV